MSVGTLARKIAAALATSTMPRSVFTPRVAPSLPANVQKVMFRARTVLLATFFVAALAILPPMLVLSADVHLPTLLARESTIPRAGASTKVPRDCTSFGME